MGKFRRGFTPVVNFDDAALPRSLRVSSKSTTGFTLMEALISISIMLISVVAAMSLATQSIRLISVTRERMIASLLARESMELLRNRRDRNFIELILKATGDATFGFSGDEGWLDELMTPERRNGRSPCKNGSDGCVVLIDPVPITKNSEEIVAFARCTNFDDDKRCGVVTNSGLTSNPVDLEDFCDGAEVCDGNTTDPKYGFLYRNFKKSGGSVPMGTKFQRKSDITWRGSGDTNCEEMAIVTTRVKWSGRFGNREIVVEDHLYNWVGDGLLGVTDSCK